MCHNKDYTFEIAPVPSLPTHEDAGDFESIAWDPSNLEIHGSESHEGAGNDQWTQTWTFVPAGDPTP